LRAGQNPDLSWARVERYGRGSNFSSSEMGGGADWRTLLGEREAMQDDTAEVWRELIVGLYEVAGMIPLSRYCDKDERNRLLRVCLI